MKPIRYHVEALAELTDQAMYYERCQSGLGLRYVEAVEAALSRVTDAPDRWPQAPGGTRRVTVRRFPYIIYYMHLSDAVFVVAVAPQRRRPRYWITRTE